MSDPQITEEMFESAAVVLSAYMAQSDAYDAASDALRAALAGRTVLDLPEPDVVGRRGSKTRTWFPAGWEIVAHVAYTGDAGVDDGDRMMSAGHAEDHGLALVAAAREARRLAAVSSKGGEPRAK